jgi:hypothetical protein
MLAIEVKSTASKSLWNRSSTTLTGVDVCDPNQQFSSLSGAAMKSINGNAPAALVT